MIKTTFSEAERKDLLERLAERDEVFEYLIKTFKHDEYALVHILRCGMDTSAGKFTDYANLKDWLGDDSEQSQAEMDADENSYMDRQR